MAKLACKYFYTKQWKEWKIPYGNVIIHQSDDPVDQNWRQFYTQECKLQERFFEAL